MMVRLMKETMIKLVVRIYSHTDIHSRLPLYEEAKKTNLEYIVGNSRGGGITFHITNEAERFFFFFLYF